MYDKYSEEKCSLSRRLLVLYPIKENPCTYINKWNEALTIETNCNMWSEFLSANFRAIIESKLQAFQYKILTRTLVTNRWLFKYNGDFCYFCKQERETIEYLFWKCTLIKKCIYTVLKGK